MKKNQTITGTLLYYDVENSNGRIYTKECAEDIVKQFNEGIHNQMPMMGQIGYPEGDEFRGRLENVSHRITEIHLNPAKKAIVGTFEILETPQGKKLWEMIDNDPEKFKETYCLRSRGTGNVNENKEVVDFNIISFDVVSRDTDAFKQYENNGN